MKSKNKTVKTIKTIIVLALVFCLSIFSAGCFFVGNKPEDVAVNYLEAAANYDINKMDENSIVPSKIIFMAGVENAKKSQNMTEEEIWETYAKWFSLDKVPKNFEEYIQATVEYSKKELADKYGDNYSCNVSIIGLEEMDEGDINDMLHEASDHYDDQGIIISDIVDFSKIKQCKKITCKVYYSGEKVDQNSDDAVTEQSVFVVNIDGRWKVLNLGLAS